MSGKSKQWLWFVPKWPLPAIDGARQANTRLIKHLSAQGQPIHLVAFVDDPDAVDVAEAQSLLGVADVTLLHKSRGRGALGYLMSALTQPGLPITLAPYCNARANTVIAQLMQTHPGQPIVFDCLHAGAWISSLPVPDGTDVVYRAHNVERDIWVRAADDARDPLRSALLRWQARKVERFEKGLCRSSAAVFPVSDDDRDIFAGWGTPAKLQTIPIGMDAPDYRPSGDNAALQLLFIGRLDWPPNRDGLRWFLEEVWPRAAASRADLELTVVGSGDGSWLQTYESLDRVEILGFVDDIEPYYLNADATLVPVFYGSGTRVKAIESCLRGRACISTRVGVEGIGLQPQKHYAQVETADEWIELLTVLDREKAGEMGRAARELVKPLFDAGRVAETMRAAMA